MNFKFRNPPKLDQPSSSRWKGVIRISTQAEIWFLDLRSALPYHYFIVFCDVIKDIAIPRYHISHQGESFIESGPVVKGWGDRFFWSDKSQTLAIQLLHTFEYSERTETEQIFLSGNNFNSSRTFTNQELQFLPDKDFREVFPEMHPDRSRSEQ